MGFHRFRPSYSQPWERAVSMAWIRLVASSLVITADR